MIVTRVTVGVVLALYVVLWLIALDGATSLIGPLVIPLVLAVIVALGVALNRFIGIKPREQHFSDSEDDASK